MKFPRGCVWSTDPRGSPPFFVRTRARPTLPTWRWCRGARRKSWRWLGRHEHYEDATTPTRRITGHLFGSLPVPTRFLRGSCSLLPALPSGWRSRIEPGSLFDRRSPLPVHSHVDVSGTSQVSRRSILYLCPGPGSRPNQRPLATVESVSSMLPPRPWRRRLQLAEISGPTRGFSTCCLRFMGDVATAHARIWRFMRGREHEASRSRRRSTRRRINLD